MHLPIIKYLELFESLSPDDKLFIQSQCNPISLKPGEYFLKAGQVSNHIGFISTGVVRIYFVDDRGIEITRYFLKENQFAVNLSSYNSGNRSTEFIQAITHCKMIVLSREGMENLEKEIPAWAGVTRRITENSLLEKLHNHTTFGNGTALTRYKMFLMKQPDIVLRVPLLYIASYLGITPQSLSRIRKLIH